MSSGPEAEINRTVEPIGPERTVEQTVARKLRRLILDGALRPGERLRYRDLASQFQVSVTPVRIALRELTIEGLVELRAHEGARVAPLSLDDLAEVYATRIGIEAWLARRGAPNVDEDAFTSMDSLLATAELATRQRDREMFLGASWGYRCVCYRAAGWPRLTALAQTLYERSTRYHGLTLDVPLRFEESMAFLQRFDDACKRKSGDDAAAVLAEILERSATYILERLSTDSDASAPTSTLRSY